MKHLYTSGIIMLLFSVWVPNKVLCANDKQLITEMRVIDNDSTFRYLYLYDNQGNKVVETKFYQQGNNWLRISINEWIFDGNKCITQRESVWSDNGWVISYTIDYVYDNELLITETHNIYTLGIAALLKKIDYQYNLSTLISSKESGWQSNVWTLGIQNDFSYLKNGLTNSIMTTDYHSDNINSQSLSTFLYNSDGTLQSQLLQEKVGNDFVNTGLTDWFYMPASLSVISQRNKKWKVDTSTWENTQKIDYLYNNENTNLLSETYQLWKSSFWENDIRYDYSYDTGNNLFRKTLSKPIYTDWRSLVSINYSNFTMNKADDIESNYEFWGGTTNMLTTSYIPFVFNNDISIQKGSSIHLVYSPVDTALYTPVENNELSMIPVYPNPSNGIFYVNTQKFIIKSWAVTDMNGQILKEQAHAFQSGIIDITDFPKGIYILHVSTQDEHMIQKLIKE